MMIPLYAYSAQPHRTNPIDRAKYTASLLPVTPMYQSYRCLDLSDVLTCIHLRPVVLGYTCSSVLRAVSISAELRKDKSKKHPTGLSGYLWMMTLTGSGGAVAPARPRRQQHTNTYGSLTYSVPRSFNPASFKPITCRGRGCAVSCSSSSVVSSSHANEQARLHTYVFVPKPET